jgi:molybdopterin-guanine dinucleotide biosynthesis adapter protein
LTTGNQQRVFGVTGWKNSGKTGLTVRVVEELTRRGWHVSTIKHAHHSFDIDRENTDSHRHRLAGATEVAIVSGQRWALMHELRGDTEPSMDAILARLAPCDIVIIEGYKRESHPKIEARRLDAANRAPLAAHDPAIVAIAADHPVTDTDLPVFDLDDTHAIVGFIERVTGLVHKGAATG